MFSLCYTIKGLSHEYCEILSLVECILHSQAPASLNSTRDNISQYSCNHAIIFPGNILTLTLELWGIGHDPSGFGGMFSSHFPNSVLVNGYSVWFQLSENIYCGFILNIFVSTIFYGLSKNACSRVLNSVVLKLKSYKAMVNFLSMGYLISWLHTKHENHENLYHTEK